MSEINAIRKRIKLLQNQLAIEFNKLEKAEADVLEPNKECCGVIYDKMSEYNKHRATKKCMIERNVPNFRCKICNKRFFDGAGSLEELMADNVLYMKSTYRKHINPINNPKPCKTYCNECDVQFDSLYMAQKHKNCSKIKKKSIEKSETEPEPEPEAPPAYAPKKIKHKFKVKRKKTPSPSPEPESSSNESSDDLSHIIDVTIDGYRYYHNTKTNAIYDAMDEYQGQAIFDDHDYLYGIDRDYDKPPKKKSNHKVI